MPRDGAVYNASEAIRQTKPRPWSADETAKLAGAFIDLDLDGSDLYRWCRENGVDRQPAAIDAQIARMAFFDNDAIKEKARQFVLKRSRAPGHIPPMALPHYQKLADRELANQIKLAKMEMSSAPPYKPKDSDLW